MASTKEALYLPLPGSWPMNVWDQSRLINIHSIIPLSRVNGPGSRMTIFFQGCIHDCPGCFNPGTHTFDMKDLYAPEDIFRRYLLPDVEGVTISGGEPFCQSQNLCRLLRIAQQEYSLSTIIYTGFLYERLATDEVSRQCLNHTDVLVDGQFDSSMPEESLLARGSSNQQFHFLTEIYSLRDFVLPAKSEVIIDASGQITETGFSRTSFKVG